MQSTLPQGGITTKNEAIETGKERKRKGRVFIPRDFLLDDIFPFLSSRQLYPLRFVGRIWKRLIDCGVASGRLSGRTVIHKITFMTEEMKKLEVKDGTEEKPVYWIVKVKAVNLGARNPVEMDEEQLDFDDAVLQEVLKKKLSLVVDTSVGDAYYVYIDPDKDCAAERRLLLKLPILPNTIAELRFVRYWMRQLSRAHFTHGMFQSTQPAFHRDDRDHQAAPFNHALFDELFPDKNKNGGRGGGFYFSFGTLETRLYEAMHRSLAALARIGHLHCTSLVWEHVDFFTDWRYTMRSAEVRLLLFSITDVLGFVRLLTTRLKRLDTGQLLGQIPRTIRFKFANFSSLKWVNDDDLNALQASGLVRLVQTLPFTELGYACSGQRHELLLVECATATGGVVHAWITLKVLDRDGSDVYQPPLLSEILLQIVEA